MKVNKKNKLKIPYRVMILKIWLIIQMGKKRREENRQSREKKTK